MSPSAIKKPEPTAPNDAMAEVLKKVVIGGDLATLSPADQLFYYRAVCESLGLNPLTRPFEYLVLNDKLTLYARADATNQLRRKHDISVKITNRELLDGLYVVTAQATAPGGRTDEAIGAVPLVREQGEWKTAPNGKRFYETAGGLVPMTPADRANGIMRAETKAKRRVTLSIAGLGILDESELDTMLEPGQPPPPPARDVEVPRVAFTTDDAPITPAESAGVDRDALLERAHRLAGTLKLTAKQRAQLWQEHCQGAGPDNVDVAALTDLVAALERIQRGESHV